MCIYQILAPLQPWSGQRLWREKSWQKSPFLKVRKAGRASKLRRKVKSAGMTVPVDAHERTRDYLTEDEFLTLLEDTKGARYRWRDSAMLMLTFYHGLRASEVCHLRRQDVDLTHGRIWIARLKGSLSTEQPLLPQELRQRPVSEINQQA
jgi:integrase